MKPSLVTAFFLTAFLSLGCVSQQEPQQTESVISVGEGKPVEGLPETCHRFANDQFKAPHYVAENSVVITRVINSCISRDGYYGYEDKSSWMAMGFPCTGGEGKVSIKGKLANPKMVSFIVSNACPMVPSEKSVVRDIAKDRLGVPLDVRLVAYYPFALQYWELLDFQDADTGFSIDFRTKLSLTDGWKAFVEGEPKA